VWALLPRTGGWIACRKSNCLVHLRDCPHQSRDIRDQAGIEREAFNKTRRVGASRHSEFTGNILSIVIGQEQQAISGLVNVAQESPPRPLAAQPELLEPANTGLRALQATPHNSSYISSDQLSMDYFFFDSDLAMLSRAPLLSYNTHMTQRGWGAGPGETTNLNDSDVLVVDNARDLDVNNLVNFSTYPCN
jgi:hypothetical protein